MAGRRIRILSDDEHADVVERLRERAQHISSGREVAATSGILVAQELPHLRDVLFDRRECLRPTGIDEFAQRLWGHDQSSLLSFDR